VSVTDDLNEDWTEYYDEQEGREPRPMLLEVLDRFDTPGEAIDLGCGTGIETRAMLERGWSVFASDRQEEAILRTRRRAVAAGVEDRLTTIVAPMEDVDVPAADLVWASFSLFFCHRTRFEDVWSKVTGAIRPGGRFAGHLLGDRDTWARQLDDVSSFTPDRARALFEAFEIERFDEEEREDEPGPKWWHVFHVVARMR
jgi:SAM-dependent methyltransferase